jgi:hypothetical protein
MSEKALPGIGGEIALPEMVIYSGVAFVDDVIHGFRPSLIYFVEAPADLLDHFIYKALVRCVLDFDRKISIVECGSTFNPYEIARMCKAVGASPSMILEEILVARPFTAYQLNTLFDSKLPDMLEKHEPLLLFFSHFPDLFLSGDVPSSDAEVIFARVLDDIGRLRERDMIIMLTSRMERRYRKRKFVSSMYESVDTYLSLRRRGASVIAHLHKDPIFGEGTAVFPIVPFHQRTLDAYLGGSRYGKNGTHV